MKNKKQLCAISYAITRRAKARRQAFIIDKEGSLADFNASRYKSEYWYILSKYNIRIY